MTRKLTYSQAINEALEISLKKDRKVIALGLGVDDPKGIFGTTKGLKKNLTIRYLICLQLKMDSLGFHWD